MLDISLAQTKRYEVIAQLSVDKIITKVCDSIDKGGEESLLLTPTRLK